MFRGAKERAGLLTDIPTDPMAAAQQVLSGQIDGSQKAFEVRAKALKGYVNLVNEFWSHLEKASQETRQHYLDFASKLQAIAETTTGKS